MNYNLPLNSIKELTMSTIPEVNTPSLSCWAQVSKIYKDTTNSSVVSSVFWQALSSTTTTYVLPLLCKTVVVLAFLAVLSTPPTWVTVAAAVGSLVFTYFAIRAFNFATDGYDKATWLGWLNKHGSTYVNNIDKEISLLGSMGSRLLFGYKTNLSAIEMLLAEEDDLVFSDCCDSMKSLTASLSEKEPWSWNKANKWSGAPLQNETFEWDETFRTEHLGRTTPGIELFGHDSSTSATFRSKTPNWADTFKSTAIEESCSEGDISWVETFWDTPPRSLTSLKDPLPVREASISPSSVTTMSAEVMAPAKSLTPIERMLDDINLLVQTKAIPYELFGLFFRMIGNKEPLDWKNISTDENPNTYQITLKEEIKKLVPETLLYNLICDDLGKKTTDIAFTAARVANFGWPLKIEASAPKVLTIVFSKGESKNEEGFPMPYIKLQFPDGKQGFSFSGIPYHGKLNLEAITCYPNEGYSNTNEIELTFPPGPIPIGNVEKAQDLWHNIWHPENF